MGDVSSGFLGVFEQRVQSLRKRLKKELEKDKPDRNKRLLKDVIKQIKKWEQVLTLTTKILKNVLSVGKNWIYNK